MKNSSLEVPLDTQDDFDTYVLDHGYRPIPARPGWFTNGHTSLHRECGWAAGRCWIRPRVYDEP